jgi:hypothetical protein
MTRLTTLALISSSFLAPATSLASSELWVVGEKSRNITVIDPSLPSVLASISLADSVEPPSGIAFSTTPAQQGTYAFVPQGPFLRVLEVLPRLVLWTHDIQSLVPGGAALELVDCASAGPRSFLPVSRTLLHCAARLGSEARYIILDQEALIANTPGKLVAHGILAPHARGIGVVVLDAPLGTKFQRAYYTVRDTDPGEQRVDLFELTLPFELVPGASVTTSLVREIQTGPAPTGADRLRIGNPTGRELTVVPRSNEGFIENLNTGGSCPAPGRDLIAASASGVGPGSYSVAALDRANSELVAFNAQDCSQVAFPVGDLASDIAVIGLRHFEAYAVTSHADDVVTFIDVTGNVVTLPLTAQPPPGDCEVCPIAAGLSLQPRCEWIGAVVDEEVGTDGIRISWSSQCPPGTRYAVWCTCRDETESCPDSCACLPDDPLCEFGGLSGPSAGPSLPPPLGSGAFDALVDPVFGGVPWKELGDTTETEYTHDDPGAETDQLIYAVTEAD